MKNILLLTHIYPGAGTPDTYTQVVHYFAKEWVKMGYRVLVIHSNAYFPRVYYWVLSLFRQSISKRFDFVLPEKRLSEDVIYAIDGVKVFRKSNLKYIPSGIYPKRVLDKEVNSIQAFLKEENFIPDYIISHWINPQIYLSAQLKTIYSAKTALVLHDNGSKIMKFPQWARLHDSIDVWGYRSLVIKRDFEKLFGEHKKMFRCFSGIPASMLLEPSCRDWSNIRSYIYVGTLISRKFPDVAVKAVSTVFKNEDYQLNIIGNGALYENLQNYILNNGLSHNVFLRGRLQRQEIIKYLDNSDVFVMISKDEVFGLVYLEAMARGCIVIAAKNEGMQGVINDGVNGFLCEAGNQKELEHILCKIHSLPAKLRSKISENAKITASQYTNEAVAKMYLDNIVSL